MWLKQEILKKSKNVVSQLDPLFDGYSQTCMVYIHTFKIIMSTLMNHVKFFRDRLDAQGLAIHLDKVVNANGEIKYASVSEFIFRNCNKDVYFDIWLYMTDRSNFKKVVQSLRPANVWNFDDFKTTLL